MSLYEVLDLLEVVGTSGDLFFEGGSVFVECCDLACENCVLKELLFLFSAVLEDLELGLEAFELSVLSFPVFGLCLNGLSESGEFIAVGQCIIESILLAFLHSDSIIEV